MARSKHEDVKNDFIIMRANGFSLKEISKAIGISQRTAERWNTDETIQARILDVRRVHVEELLGMGALDRDERIKSLTGTLRQIDEAIAVTDISKLSADELLSLKIRYMKAIRDEENAGW